MALSKIKEYSQPPAQETVDCRGQSGRAVELPANSLGHDDVDISVAATGKDALKALNEQTYDCMVLDLRLPDMSGFEFFEHLRDTPSLSGLPVVVFTGKELSPEEDARLHTLARSVVVKGVESPERLLDETALFLHRVIAHLPPEKQTMLDRLHRSDEALVGERY